MDPSILVTGGAGYIGSVTVERLVSAGRRVVVLDDLSKGHRAAVAPGVPLVEGDVGDADLVERVLRENGVEAVIHFAAMSLVGESMEQPFLYVGDNVRNALNVLEEAVGQVALDELGPRVDRLTMTKEQIVDDDNLVSLVYQFLSDDAADVARSACYQYLHTLSSRGFSFTDNVSFL